MTDATAAEIEDDITAITATIAPSAPPTLAEVTRDYGPDKTERLLTNTTGAIERSCEETIAKMYAAVEIAEARTKALRERTDTIAEAMRDVSKRHAGELADHILACQRMHASFEEHARDFAAGLDNMDYPRVQREAAE